MPIKHNIKPASKPKAVKRAYGGVEATERQEARHKQLIKAGLEAFGTKGYNNSSIKAVCQLANLTERYFYESFSNKEALLIAVYTDLIDELKGDFFNILSASELSGSEKVYQSLSMFYRHLRDDPYRAQVQLFEVLGVSKNVTKVYRDAMADLTNQILIMAKIMYPKSDPKSDDARIIAIALSGAIIQVGHEWVLSEYEKPLEDILSPLMQGLIAAGGTLNK